MSDGMIGYSRVTIPDLIEPVVGFRSFQFRYARQEQLATPDRYEEVFVGVKPGDAPFKEPNEYVIDPVTGKFVKNYEALAEAYKKWQGSLGRYEMRRIPGTPYVPATPDTLVSPNHGAFEWNKGTNTAVCAHGHMGLTDINYLRKIARHVAPYPDCQCGLYSYYDAEKWDTSVGVVAAIVTSWGKIEAHETGMRSEFMKVEAICCSSLGPQKLAEEWGIPFIRYIPGGTPISKLLEPLACEFGSPLPESMRPKEQTSKMVHSQFGPPRPYYPKYPKTDWIDDILMCMFALACVALLALSVYGICQII